MSSSSSSNVLTEEKLRELINFSDRVWQETGRKPFDIQEMIRFSMLKYRISQGEDVGQTTALALPAEIPGKEQIVNYQTGEVTIVDAAAAPADSSPSQSSVSDSSDIDKEVEAFSCSDVCETQL